MASPLAAQIAPAAADPTNTISAYRWVIAWIVLLIILALISRFKIGYTIIYYLLLLSIIFLVLTQYQAITSLLSPFNQENQNA